MSGRCVDLFAGAGGASLGLEQAGLRHTLLVELDPVACETLRWNSWTPFEGDVREVPGHVLRAAMPVDLLWASPPCQPFSKAGAKHGVRKGKEDDRNGFPWTFDVIDAVNPTWVVLENVAGLRNSEYCEEVKQELRSRFAWADIWELNAANFGVPQKRHRVFFVAGPEFRRIPSPTQPNWSPCGEALGLPTGLRVVGGGSNPRKKGDARTYRDLTDEPCTTITAAEVGNRGPWIVRGPVPAKISSDELRSLAKTKLTIKELAVLQGFPVDYRFAGTRAQQHRQVGNAVPPVVAKTIAERLMEWD